MFSEDTLLRNHLQYDIFPPIDVRNMKVAIPKCKDAIDACVGGEHEKKIQWPNGVVWTASETVANFNLNGFVTMRLQEQMG